MKKIFTLILTMVTLASFAQSLTLTYEGTPVNNGDTVEVIVPQLNITADYYLDITNITDNDVNMIIYKNDLDMVEGASSSLCIGGTCYPPVTTESAPKVIAAHSTLAHATSQEAFHLGYKTPAAGTSYVMFTFANYDNSDDCTSMVFKLVYDPTNIEAIPSASKLRAYPNPASDNVTVEYAVSGNVGKAQLVIKNMLGATLYTKNIDINANKVKVDVSEYPAGIYFYSIEADGRPLVTKKLLVK